MRRTKPPAPPPLFKQGSSRLRQRGAAGVHLHLPSPAARVWFLFYLSFYPRSAVMIRASEPGGGGSGGGSLLPSAQIQGRHQRVLGNETKIYRQTDALSPQAGL